MPSGFANSLNPKILDAIALGGKEVTAVAGLGEFRGRQELFRQQAPEALEALRRVALVESTESSNRIEGVVLPRERVEALVLRPAAPSNRTEEEVAGYRDALNLIHESATEMDFSVNVVIQLHTLLYRHMQEQGGRWKNAPNDIVERAEDGSIHRVRFTPVTPVATPQAMHDLTAEYRQALNDGREPLLIVPLAILDFLCIHPYRDGNGRMSRLLTLMLLYQAGFIVGRYVSIERIIEESKETYYEALERSSKGWHDGSHDPLPWMRYFWGVLTAACKEFEQRVGEIRDAPGAKTSLIEQAVRRRFKPFALVEIEAECPGVSRDMVRHVLRKMRDRGEVRSTGRGRAAKWARVKE